VVQELEERGELPWVTKILLGSSHLLLSWPGLMAGAASVFGVLIFMKWARTDAGRFRLDGWRLRIPGAGKIYLSLALARFTRILGTLLHNGIPILQALRIAKDSTGNKVLSQAVNQAADNVTAGNS